MIERAMITGSLPSANDYFGIASSISNNGLVLAVGAYLWSGAVSNQGAVYIFDWDGAAWVERGKVTASDAGSNDRFGTAVGISGDGSVLAVGATFWDGTFTDQGAVYIFDWNGSSWVERSILTASDEAASDRFGTSCSLSADGKTLATGAFLWDGIAANQGAVYILDWNGSAWVERSIITAADYAANDYFGSSCSLSSNGGVLSVGSYLWEGPTSNQGVVYIYDWFEGAWVERGQVTASDPASGDRFGIGSSISGDGSVLAVGATFWEGTFADQGAVYIFDWNGSSWVERVILTASDAGAGDSFGSACSLSDDGHVVIIGAFLWDGAAANQGAVYMFDSSLRQLPKIRLHEIALKNVLLEKSSII